MADDDFRKQLELEAQEKFRKEQGASSGSDPYTYTDPSGTVYEWNVDKHAWFPKIDDDFIAQYQSNYNYAESSSEAQSAVTSSQSQKDSENLQKPLKPGEKRKANDPCWFEVDDEHNTNVYVSGLPLSTTDDEFIELMSKCGLVMKDPDTMKFKAKLYRESSGEAKGDGRCCYIRIESVKLALDILDGYLFKGNKIHVERAQFQLKGQYDPSKKPKKKKSKDKEKIKKKLEKAEKKFFVVKFVEENSVSVVPRSWLKAEGGRALCCWPPSAKDMTDMIKCEVAPHPSWKFYEVSVIFKSRTYENADKYLEVFESEDNVLESESSSEEEEEAFIPIVQLSNSSAALGDLERAFLSGPVLEGQCASCVNMSVNFERVFSILSDLKTEVSRQSILLETLLGGAEDLRIPEGYTLPVNTMADIKDLENRLENDVEFLKMTKYLGSIGGKDHADCARRVMSCVIGNSLARALLWAGSITKRSIQEFPKVLQVMTAGVRFQKAYKDSSQTEFEAVLKRWLRCSVDRNGGRKERMKRRK